MKKPIRARRALAGGLVALALFFGPAVPYAQAEPGNLPVYTSPIDVTGLKVQLRASAPDRETGQPVDVALPVGLIGPKMNELFSTPLSAQIDQYWNADADPKTGMTPRAAACDAKDGIKDQVVKQVATIGSSYSAYDISCSLASRGQLVAKQIGSTIILGYLLTNNSVSFASTSPYTCRAGSSIVCPNDPRFTVHFATEITTVIRTPGLCQLVAEGGTVYVVGASIDSHNAAAAFGKFVQDQKFLAAEIAMTNTVRNQKLPLDDSFKELRTSDACTGKTPGASRVLAAFGNFEADIDLRAGIILRASHVGIAAPSLDGPGFVGGAPFTSVPSFTRPLISTTQPLVTAGVAVQTNGQYFPLSSNTATVIPVSMRHGGYGGNSSIPVCSGPGSATSLDWGPAGGARRVVQLAGDTRGNCVADYDAVNLVPGTAYTFRARDCDPITCSPWSAMITAKTAKSDPVRGHVILTLDAGTPLGTATVDTQGRFQSTVTVPAGTPAGTHTIHAVDGDTQADVSIGVTSPSPAGASNASIMMVALLNGETGCPNHPITSTQTDSTFTLFGVRFAAGTVTIHLDSAMGGTLGIAMVRPDGSICGQMQSAAGSHAGAHTLVAVQNGVVATQTAVTFVRPSLVR